MNRIFKSVAQLSLIAMTASFGVVSFAGNTPAKGPQAAAQPPGVDQAPLIGSIGAMRDGFRWGQSPQEIVDAHAKGTNSIFWKDYDERLVKMHVGPDQTAVEHERDAFIDSFKQHALTRFDHPGSGWESSPVRAEYTVGNHESLVLVERKGKKRYFFFINDRLYKIYDEYPLVAGGPMGATWAEAYQKLGMQIGGVTGRALAPDPKTRPYQLIDWHDNEARSNYLRLIDRTAEHVVGVSISDAETERNMPNLRSHHEQDPMDLDPGVAAVTNGQGRTDPNAAHASPSASASAKPKK